MCRESDDAPLGTATHCAGYLAMGALHAAAGEDKAVMGGETAVKAVDGALDGGDAFRGHAGGEPEVRLGVAGQVAADVEKRVLDVEHQCAKVVGRGRESGEQPYVGVEFVNGSVSLEAVG